MNEKNKAWQRQMRRDPTRWPQHIVRTIRARCKAEGRPFNITAADIVVPEICPILRVPFVFGAPGHPHSPSVDKFDPSKGYTPGNVRVIARQANSVKNAVTDPSVFERVAAYVRGEL